MVLYQNIQHFVCKRVGCELIHSSLSEVLSEVIFRVRKKCLGINTLKNSFELVEIVHVGVSLGCYEESVEERVKGFDWID